MPRCYVRALNGHVLVAVLLGTAPVTTFGQVADANSVRLYATAMGRALTDTMSRHLLMTPRRRPSREDSLRAERIVTELRRAIAKYRDTAVAIAEGYRLLPPYPDQPVLHYGNGIDGLLEMSRFDPTHPSALLYRRESRQHLRLIGAMYTAPEASTLAELNRRIPVSVGTWHRHVDICLPKPGDSMRWMETFKGHPRFGPDSYIATRSACNHVNGNFLDAMDPWMIHAYVFLGTAPGIVWGDGEMPANAESDGTRAVRGRREEVLRAP